MSKNYNLIGSSGRKTNFDDFCLIYFIFFVSTKCVGQILLKLKISEQIRILVGTIKIFRMEVPNSDINLVHNF